MIDRSVKYWLFWGLVVLFPLIHLVSCAKYSSPPAERRYELEITQEDREYFPRAHAQMGALFLGDRIAFETIMGFGGDLKCYTYKKRSVCYHHESEWAWIGEFYGSDLIKIYQERLLN